MLISFLFPFCMIIDKINNWFFWYFVKIDFFENFENYQFVKVYVREMQKFHKFSHSQKFLFMKVSMSKVFFIFFPPFCLNFPPMCSK